MPHLYQHPEEHSDESETSGLAKVRGGGRANRCHEANRKRVTLTALRDWILAISQIRLFLLRFVGRQRDQRLAKLARQTARRAQGNVQVCHSRPIRWQFDVLFSEMTFSHSLQSVNREMSVVDLVVSPKKRKTKPDSLLKKRHPRAKRYSRSQPRCPC